MYVFAFDVSRKYFKLACLEGGHWEETGCEPISCPALPDVFQGMYTCTNSLYYDTVCTLQCSDASENVWPSLLQQELCACSSCCLMCSHTPLTPCRVHVAALLLCFCPWLREDSFSGYSSACKCEGTSLMAAIVKRIKKCALAPCFQSFWQTLANHFCNKK